MGSFSPAVTVVVIACSLVWVTNQQRYLIGRQPPTQSPRLYYCLTAGQELMLSTGTSTITADQIILLGCRRAATTPLYSKPMFRIRAVAEFGSITDQQSFLGQRKLF